MLSRLPFVILLLCLCALRAGALVVTFPNGGQVLGPDVDHSIQWTSSVGGSVRIELLKDGALFSTITSSTTNDGTRAWRFDTTQQPGGTFRIRITSTSNPAETDTSDAEFCISSASFDRAIPLEAATQVSPAQIMLKWPKWPASNVSNYTIYRRAPGGGGAASWGTVVAPLPKDATSYTDTNVSVGTIYEYRVSRNPTSGTIAHGYLHAGILIPLVEHRGKIILVVDNTMAGPLSLELSRLARDLVGDGWEVIRRDVSRSASAPEVKSVIKAVYDADPQNVKAALLFGHVRVPYSGRIAPDGHGDHFGAWPADCYYADLDGTWTDSTVNTTSPSRSENDNVPGDGKWDQNNIPTDVEIAIGRVDLANLSAFALSETELLRQYLNKAHRYRFKQLTAPNRALIDDEFNDFMETHWRGAGALCGLSEIFLGDWKATLGSNDYLFAAGAGPGSYTSAGSVTSTTDIAAQDPRAIFTSLFGSYFGDWDNSNNLLRAPLATSMGLACVWAGRPGWLFHPLALGDTMGAAWQLTQNNSTVNFSIGSETRRVHIALMGDPALRWHVVAPPSQVTLAGQTLSWTASPEPEVLGYHIYSSASELGPYARVNPALVFGTTFSDPALNSAQVYMVRAVKRETTLAGTFFNASQGAFLSPNATAAAIVLTPADPTVFTGATQQFSAVVVDQFGYPLAQQPASFSWSCTGPGTVDAAGLFTAGSTTGYANVTASNGLRSGSVAVTVNATPGTGAGLVAERWDGVAGANVADLRAWPAFPHFPSSQSLTTSLFETGANVSENYGRRMRGIFTAPVTGAYRFLISTDDSGELRFSPDMNPNNATVIASVNGFTSSSRHWSKYSSQTSALISLTAGQQCYLEALHKEAAGGDHLGVGMDLPGGVPERPLFANRMNPFPGWVPAPWSQSDLGTTTASLTAQAFAEFLPATGSFNLRNAGGSDIGGAADAFRFARQSVSGDVVITARVAGIANTSTAASAGVMIRQDANANAANAAVLVTESTGARVQARTSAGGNTTASTVAGIAPPYWVRLERVGSRFRGSISANGTDSWQRIGADLSVTLNDPVLVGIAATSRNTAALGMAEIGDVSVVPLTPVQSWRARHDLPFDGTGQGEDLADPESDGVPNLLEYALGLAPRMADAHALPAADVQDGRLAITFQRDPAFTDLTYTVEAAPSVSGPWIAIARSSGGTPTANLGGAFSVSETDTIPHTVTVVDAAPPTETNPRFLRLRVSR